ncbi:MAG: hypothetical protein K6U14_07255 [Firmicutes bacterium]|nr:hypothetical protein [Alicyclobacillaceae bacterium]MCL6497415.1 hypothetical protein [Bacillota bacterium]
MGVGLGDLGRQIAAAVGLVALAGIWVGLRLMAQRWMRSDILDKPIRRPYPKRRPVRPTPRRRRGKVRRWWAWGWRRWWGGWHRRPGRQAGRVVAFVPRKPVRRRWR